MPDYDRTHLYHSKAYKVCSGTSDGDEPAGIIDQKPWKDSMSIEAASAFGLPVITIVLNI